MRRLVVLLAVLASVMPLTSCGMFTEEPMKLTARFRDSVGLFPGNNVSILGLQVGTVTAIEPKGTSVEVRMDIDAGTQIPANAGAVTVSPSVVTDRHVELTPVYTGGPTMRGGDLIPLERTRTPVEFDRVIAAVDGLTAELTKGQPGAVGDALDVTADTFAGNGDRLRHTVEELAKAVNVGTDQIDPLTRLIRNADTLTKAAADNDGTIRSFSTNLTRTVEMFNSQGPALSTAFAQLNDLLDQVDQVITANKDLLHRDLAGAQNTVNTLRGRSRELAEIIDVLPTTFQNVHNAVDFDQNAARVHVNIDEALVNLPAGFLPLICGRLHLTAPGCDSGRLADFGADLGLTEAILGGAPR